MSARDSYLAYQAEIGTEEVVLPKPWIRKSILQTQPSQVVSEGPGFLQSITQALASKTALSAPVPSAPEEAPRAVALPSLPKFKDLDAYWKFLDEEYPKWFPQASPALARGEGMHAPILAIVEMAPAAASPTRILDGETGLLFDKMMKAIHLDRGQLYLTSVMKTPPSGKSWPRKDIARMLPCLFRELELAGCSTVLLLGEACAQAVLKTGRGLDALRRQPVEAEGFVFTASYHPSELETNQELKRSAWEDLKWLGTRLGVRGA